MALAYCLRSCRLPTSASGVDHVGSSAYQLTTLQPFSSEHRNVNSAPATLSLIDTYEVLNGGPRGVFCVIPFSGSATRCPTEIPTKEETTQAGGPVCKARSVFWPPRILMYSQNTCNGGFVINKVTVWSQREINTIYTPYTHGISRNLPHANAGDPSKIIREGADSDARSIDLKVVPCTPHYVQLTYVRSDMSLMQRQA
ncbi:hypothetical protein ALC62_03497 [Cyphomyrmex costatus]|uniref:Uncharacterized protein n=1 Tax=Cyphomyrmex costatus TaxID=456900 RepID=A0A151ILH1_9HYME|nr:hypothetical protein ALC62_03497 [Cyphomyrmex costatus]